MKRQKITCSTLADLKSRFEEISINKQREYFGGGDGTYSNPYSWGEFLAYTGNSSVSVWYIDPNGEKVCELPDVVVTAPAPGNGGNTDYNYPYYGGYSTPAYYGYLTPAYYGYSDPSYNYYGGSPNHSTGGGGGGSSASNSSFTDVLDIVTKVNDFVTSIESGLDQTGITRIGDNYKIYFATSSGGVFYGNQYVKTHSLVNLGSKIGRIAGPVGIALGAGQIAYAVYEDNGTFGPNTTDAVLEYAGGSAGAVAGAWTGAKTFGLIGFIIAGPAGATVGGFLGGFVGAISGGYIGGSVGKIVAEVIGESTFINSPK